MKAEKENKHSKKSIAVQSEHKEREEVWNMLCRKLPHESCLQLIAVHCRLH